MNNLDLRHIHITKYLQERGAVLFKISRGTAWYFSPFRVEKTPSFKVNLLKNLWFDFGSGEGGTLRTLAIKLGDNHYLPALVKDNYSKNRFDPNLKPVDHEDSGKIIVDRIIPLTHPGLLQYMKFRRIPKKYGCKFLREAHYRVHGKKYFALAFENDRGGFEFRNKYFKSGSSPKYYTTIAGQDDSRINLFEGFMDFLSFCAWFDREPVYKTIVLNSLSFLPQILPSLPEYRSVDLFLDNDHAGNEAYYRIKHTSANIRDKGSLIYAKHKDFNEFLMHNRWATHLDV